MNGGKEKHMEKLDSSQSYSLKQSMKMRFRYCRFKFILIETT